MSVVKEEDLKITLPSDYKSKDVFFKIQEKRQKTITTKFRSFRISNHNGSIDVKGKNFPITLLYNLLVEHEEFLDKYSKNIFSIV